MRYHPTDKAKTRARIIKHSAKRYRLEGISTVGIANLMADLGMTHGGFYAHFLDKEALVTAACVEAFSSQTQHWDKLLEQGAQSAEAFSRLLEDYLSTYHRDHPESGCFATALAGEIARRDHKSRQAFTQGINLLLQRLPVCSSTQRIPPVAMLAMMVGAVTLARAVSNPELSALFLSQALTTLLQQDN